MYKHGRYMIVFTVPAGNRTLLFIIDNNLRFREVLLYTRDLQVITVIFHGRCAPYYRNFHGRCSPYHLTIFPAACLLVSSEHAQKKWLAISVMCRKRARTTTKVSAERRHQRLATTESVVARRPLYHWQGLVLLLVDNISRAKISSLLLRSL
jgi:hypothetical protein